MSSSTPSNAPAGPPGRRRSLTHLAPVAALVAEVVATLCVALWLGGMLALGAFAAPEVFGQLERDVAGSVMGTIFAKFDRMVLVLACVLIAAEGVRVFIDGARGKLALARLASMVLLIGLALTSALWLGPSINELFAQGVRRGVDEAGADMERLHNLATTLGKVAMVFATAWIALGIVAHRRAAQPSSHDHAV